MLTVTQWLEQLGLRQYAKVFAENDIDLEALRLLAESDLEKLGVSLGHRKKLLKAVLQLDGGLALAPTVQPIQASPPIMNVRTVARTPNRRPAYVLGRSDEETTRLQAQARLVEPLTQRLFQDAGIGPGMKVLDLGAGSGDVTMLAVKLVGPNGSMLGLDVDAGILETARIRAHNAGYVSFQPVDIQQSDLEQDFDVIVGRYIMMHMPAPGAVMQTVTSHLRRGGLVAFQECDWTQSPYTVPPSPLLDQVWKWIHAAFKESGADTEIGSKLGQLFLGAGLVEPQLHGDRLIGGGANWTGYDHIVGLVKGVLPFLEASRIATAEQVAIDSLCERLRQDILRQNGVIIYRTLVRAWARKP